MEREEKGMWCGVNAGLHVPLSTGHPFSHLIDTLKSEKYGDKKYFSPQKLEDPRYGE